MEMTYEREEGRKKESLCEYVCAIMFMYVCFLFVSVCVCVCVYLGMCICVCMHAFMCNNSIRNF